MEYKELIVSAIESLRRNLMRTSLTMLGIIIGISSVILISSVGQSSVRYVTDEISAFGTNFFTITPGTDVFSGILGGTSTPLTVEDAQEIENADIPNIKAIIPIALASRIVSAEEEKLSSFIYGFTPDANEVLSLEIIYGENLSEDDRNSRVAVLGSDVAEELFGVGINPVGESIRIDDTKYKVIGVSFVPGALTGSQFNNGISVPLEVLQNDISGVEDLYEIIVSVEDTKQINETVASVEEVLRNYRDIDPGDESDFNITKVEESLDVITNVTQILTLLIAGISSISLLVGGVGVMNIMLVSVTERTKEIGLLKAIGAKEKDILTQFLIESVVMTVSGGIVGILIGVSLSILVAIGVGLPIVVSIPWIIITVVVSSLVGIIFGLYPARRASKLSPIDALRYE